MMAYLSLKGDLCTIKLRVVEISFEKRMTLLCFCSFWAWPGHCHYVPVRETQSSEVINLLKLVALITFGQALRYLSCRAYKKHIFSYFYLNISTLIVYCNEIHTFKFFDTTIKHP